MTGPRDLTTALPALERAAELVVLNDELDASSRQELLGELGVLGSEAEALDRPDIATLVKGMRASLEAAATDRSTPTDAYAETIGAVQALFSRRASVPPPMSSAATAARPWAEDPDLLRDFFNECSDHLVSADRILLALEASPAEQGELEALFRAVHSIKGLAGFLQLDQLGSVAHATESMLDKARRGTLSLAGRPLDIAFEAFDAIKRLVAVIERAAQDGTHLPHDATVVPLLERLATASERPFAEGVGNLPLELGVGDLPLEEGERATNDTAEGLSRLQRQEPPEPIAELAVPPRLATKAAPAPAAPGAQRRGEARPLESGGAAQTGKLGRATMRIDAERLGTVVDMIGELAIAQSMVQAAATSLGRVATDPKLAARLGRMGQITRDLHTLAGSLRLVPLARTFESMARVLRDAAQKTGRRARLAMVGEQTELDKALVDAIGDPLMHMVRNAVDHGLEATVEERRAVGKPDVGVVTLRAYQRGSKIIIEVADDGRGLDRKKILDRARARELLPAGRESDLTDREVYDLICSPGFSTAEKVSEVSGRGVGMDVVRNAVEALSGALDIDSQPGLGSTFSIRLPLTLAVMDGMVLRVAGERYILPISVIIRSVRPKPSDMTSVFGRGELLCLGERHVPVIRLGRLYGLDEQAGTVPFAVVVEAGSGGLVAVAVDEILGQQQVVIKSLGDGLGKLKTVSGGAIMSDGRVGLILDVEEIFQLSVMRHDSGVDRAQGVG